MSDLSGGLALDQLNDGTTTLQLANPHGDVVATATIGQPGINGYTEADEYGNPADPARTSSRYGWLGTHQRDSSTVGGLTLMGARLYNPTVGRFLSIDPIDGGNDNRYTYPADPVNKTDLDGQAWNWGLIAEVTLTIATLVIPGGIVAGLAIKAAVWGFRAWRAARAARGGIYVVRTMRGKTYVGQSSNIARRLKQHTRANKITAQQAARAKVYRVRGGKTRREIAEQRMTNRLRGKGVKLENRVNPIGKRRQHLLKSTRRNWRGL